MATYLVMLKMKGDKNYTLDGDDYRATIVEFDGDLEQAANYYTKKALYWGDQNGNPDDYLKIEAHEHEYEDVIVAPFEISNAHVYLISNELEKHNRVIEYRESKELEAKERDELKRLQRKYST